MKKIVNERYQETRFEETLENGLHVILWQKKDYVKSMFMMVTPLGAMDMKQVDENGKEYHFPAGIAHFLEHKMFEMKMGMSWMLFQQWGQMSMLLPPIQKRHIISPQVMQSRNH